MSSLIVYEDRPGRTARLAGFLKPHCGSYQDIALPGRPGHRLCYWTARTGTTAGFAALDGDDFVAFTGSFFFDGKVGIDAARAFHADFDAERFSWAGTTGHFTLVIGKAGRVFIVNDGIAAWKLYRDEAGSYVSAGFLEALLLTPKPRFDAQGVYEYVFASFALGETTMVDGVRAVMPNRLIELLPDGDLKLREIKSPIEREPVMHLPIDDMAARQSTLLEHRFQAYRAVPRDALISSISGGFDSRLMVSSFARVGLKPRMFVYGPPDDPDVTCSKPIAEHLGLDYVHIDKGKQRAEQKPEKPDAATLLFYIDGWKDDGLLGFDIDLQDRLDRGARGQYMANGKCGEIYRHFFYQRISPRGTDAKALMRSAFGRPTPSLTTARFDLAAFEARIAKSFEALTGFGDRRVFQEDLDYLYSKIRMCHDAGRDIAINHRFSHALYPFVEACLSGPALSIPYAQKLHGRLEAHMIRYQDPALAAMPTAYGYDMMAGPGLKYRLSMAASYLRPSWLRYMLPRLKALISKPLGQEGREIAGEPMITDKSHPHMRRYFRLDKVADASMFSRIMALELMGQHFHFQD